MEYVHWRIFLAYSLFLWVCFHLTHSYENCFIDRHPAECSSVKKPLVVHSCRLLKKTPHGSTIQRPVPCSVPPLIIMPSFHGLGSMLSLMRCSKAIWEAFSVKAPAKQHRSTPRFSFIFICSSSSQSVCSTVWVSCFLLAKIKSAGEAAQLYGLFYENCLLDLALTKSLFVYFFN